MCEQIMRFNTNSDITAVIKTGASNRFVFAILILFDISSIIGVLVNFNIHAIIFNRRRKEFKSLLNLIHLTVSRGLELQLH